MAAAGHKTTLKISGTGVVTTGEATTNLGSNRYQITTAARRIVDPNASLVVRDGGTPIATTGYSFDYLFGIATLTAPPGGAVTVDCTYLPTQSITEVAEFNFNGSADLLDSTTYETTGARSKKTGLVDCAGSFRGYALPNLDVDSGSGGTQSLESFRSAGTAKLLEASFDDGAGILRAWVMLEGIETSASVDGLVEVTGNFQGAAQKAGASFGFGT